jgi:hypothetical protein
MSVTAQEEMILGYQLRFWFVGVQPIVWRRLLFRADHTLADVHYAIQITCNWSDYFLHQFKIHGQSIGVPRASGPWYTKSAEEIQLSDLQLTVNERFFYEYNFFDNWQLEIRLEKIDSLASRGSYPLCLAGKGAAPPEDCGGADSFNQLRQHFSPFYIYQRLLECQELYQTRQHLTVDEQDELEECQLELGRFGYWSQVDKFDRRTANRRLKQYAVNDPGWQEFKEVNW